MRFFTGLVMLMLISVNQNTVAQQPSQQQRDAFKRAWQALGRSDWNTANAEAQVLANYPLLPYLRGEQMRQRPDAYPNDEIRAYLQRYADWSFAGSLRTSWLRWLGRSGQYNVLLQEVTESSDGLLQCYITHAKMVTNGNQPDRRQELIQDIQTVWLSAKSLPKQCDAAFTWLQRHGGITPELAWQRVALAISANETSLANYLQRFLSSDDRVWLQRWLAMRNRRASTLRAALQWPDEMRAWQVVAWGLEQQARADAAAGLQLWRNLDAHFSWPDAISMPALHSVGVFHALDLEPAALMTIDTVATEFQDQQLLDWRARTALGNGLWSQVLDSIQRMSPEGQQDERWQYWKARALQQSGQPDDARSIFKTLSNRATYYGFMSADWLNRDYRICPAPALVDKDKYQIPSQLMLERAIELFRVDLKSHAFRTWRRAQQDMDAEQHLQAAHMAADAGWLHQAIFTLNDAGLTNHYTLRFPTDHQQKLQQQTQQRGLDSALVHGLIRAESAWHPQAISGAGARGLMQVTPDTARRIAGQHGLRYRGSASLLQPDINIEFGTANLSSLLSQFGNDPVAVLAAYNAGPHVQQRWEQSRPSNPPDIWVETLPYYETRDYIPRVLAFSVVYDWRLKGSAAPISTRMPGMQTVISPAASATPTQRAVNCTDIPGIATDEPITP